MHLRGSGLDLAEGIELLGHEEAWFRFRVQVQGSGFRDQGLGSRVQGAPGFNIYIVCIHVFILYIYIYIYVLPAHLMS